MSTLVSSRSLPGFETRMSVREKKHGVERNPSPLDIESPRVGPVAGPEDLHENGQLRPFPLSSHPHRHDIDINIFSWLDLSMQKHIITS